MPTTHGDHLDRWRKGSTGLDVRTGYKRQRAYRYQVFDEQLVIFPSLVHIDDSLKPGRYIV